MPDNPVKVCPGSHEFIMFRDGGFQVEQVTLFPNYEVSPHCHPNVDTYESHLCGSGEAWLENDCGICERLVYKYDHDPKNRYHLRRLHIKPGYVHYGMADTVVVALSFQEWINGVEPSFITDDWVGDPWPDGN